MRRGGSAVRRIDGVSLLFLLTASGSRLPAQTIAITGGTVYPVSGPKIERGTVLMLTGVRTVELYPGNGGDDPMAEGPSIDQLWVEQSAALQGPPIASLQLSCDSRADTPEVSTRHMSYSGPRAPMRPYYQPLDAYMRVFGTLMPGGMSGGNMDALARARAQKQSVLDFALRDRPSQAISCDRSTGRATTLPIRPSGRCATSANTAAGCSAASRSR